MAKDTEFLCMKNTFLSPSIKKEQKQKTHTHTIVLNLFYLPMFLLITSRVTECAGTQLMRRLSKTDFNMAISVSYTHLDVYKRQF